MNDVGARRQVHQHPAKMDEVRGSVSHFVRTLKKHAAAAARSPHTNDNDKATLREATKLLDASVNNLMKIIDQHEALMLPTSGIPGAEAAAVAAGPYIIDGTSFLSSLLFAASMIGNLSLDTSVLRDEFMKKLNERTAAAVQPSGPSRQNRLR